MPCFIIIQASLLCGKSVTGQLLDYEIKLQAALGHTTPNPNG